MFAVRVILLLPWQHPELLLCFPTAALLRIPARAYLQQLVVIRAFLNNPNVLLSFVKQISSFGMRLLWLTKMLFAWLTNFFKISWMNLLYHLEVSSLLPPATVDKFCLL